MRKKMKNTEPLHVKLDEELVARLNAYADDLGQTKTMAISRILKKALDEYEAKKGQE